MKQTLIGPQIDVATRISRTIVWITWENQVRNRSMTARLGVPLRAILSNKGRASRYVHCARRTLEVLRTERPSIIICQNPSLVLTQLLLWLRRQFGFKLVIDAHFGGVQSYNGSRLLQAALDHCNRTADLVIVTNSAHADHVRRIGGRVFECPDPIPDLSKYSGTVVEVPRKCLFICSFDIDEPYREVFRAANKLWDDGFRVVVSGNYRKVDIEPSQYPKVRFLGFLPEPDFYRELFSAEIVIDLTDHENCLLCGAYEAMEAGKPLVLSRRRSLQEYFTGGTVFTENRAEEIASAVRDAHARRTRLAADCVKWKERSRLEMMDRLARLRVELQGL